MAEPPSAATASHRPSIEPLLFVLAAALLVASALTRGPNHDESQYVTAIALMRQGWPYQDFAYLQTPLQPLLLAPLAYLPAGSVLLAVRLSNAAFGFATLLLLRIALRNRASPTASMTALAALCCTDAFLLASSLARNDALAMMLIACSLPPLLDAAETGSRRMFALSGIALGLAISAKINAALPAAGAGLFLLIRAKRSGTGSILALSLGLMIGLLPTLVLAFVAPGPFVFDVFEYNLRAPAQWWTSIGEAAELGLVRRSVKLLAFASLGSVLVALVAAVLDRRKSETLEILDFMIVGGLIAALLPQPALVQYLVPLLPPLLVRFALALDELRPVLKRGLLLLLVPGSIAGLTSSLVVRFSGLAIISRTAAGKDLAPVVHGAPVATLSGQYVAGQGVVLDPRFAAGPFLFRTEGALARDAQTQGRAVTVEGLARALAEKPPGAIVVGDESHPFPPPHPQGLDRRLSNWALGHGYRPRVLAGGLVALVRPD